MILKINQKIQKTYCLRRQLQEIGMKEIMESTAIYFYCFVYAKPQILICLYDKSKFMTSICSPK